MQEIQEKLQEIDCNNLTEKQEAQMESCLKKLEKLSSSDKVDQNEVDNLKAKVEALMASTKDNEETVQTEPSSQNGGEETGAPTSEEDTQATGSGETDEDINQDDTSEDSDASDDEDQ